MKLIHSLPLAFSIACLALTGCDKKSSTGDTGSPAAPAAVDEKTALANFKTEVENAGKWIEEKQKAAGADPAAQTALVGEMVAKMKAVSTDGLPADLKAAWGEMNGVLGEMGDIFKNMPKMDKTKPEETAKAMQDFMPKMIAIQGKIAPVAAKLEEVGKKYGLDMTKVAPGK